MVKRPPRVPGVRSRLSSGQFRAHVSDLRRSRVRSSSSVTCKVIRMPFSGTAPPVLTSFDLSKGKISHWDGVLGDGER